MRRTVIAGNWKMNKTMMEAELFSDSINEYDLSNTKSDQIIFAPSYMLQSLNILLKSSRIEVGCQNMHQYESGAYTGEISADMIKSIGITSILIGHSERRQYFNESDKVVNEKLLLALEKNLTPYLCIGETLEERTAGIMRSTLKNQLVKACKNVKINMANKIIIAYEPIWAIGTGCVSNAEDANIACRNIREIVAEIFDLDIARNMIILYGGSVNPSNIDEILAQSEIDGVLVGGASLDVTSYISLLK